MKAFLKTPKYINQGRERSHMKAHVNIFCFKEHKDSCACFVQSLHFKACPQAGSYHISVCYGVLSHHSSGLWGFLRRAFSRIALALVSCPTLSSRRDSSNHRATEWGHFFNYTNKQEVIYRFLESSGTHIFIKNTKNAL